MLARRDGRIYAWITFILLLLAVSACQGEAEPRIEEPVAPQVVDVRAILERLQPGDHVVINREMGVVGIVVGRDEQNRPLLMVPPGVYGGMRPDYSAAADQAPSQDALVAPGAVIQFGPDPADKAVVMGNSWVYLGDQTPAADTLDPSRVQWLPHLFGRQGVIVGEPDSGGVWSGGSPGCQAGFELEVSVGGMRCLRLAPAATQGGPEDERTRPNTLAIAANGVLTNPSPAGEEAPPPPPDTPYWADPTRVDLELHYDFNRDGLADLVVPSQGSAQETYREAFTQSPSGRLEAQGIEAGVLVGQSCGTGGIYQMEALSEGRAWAVCAPDPGLVTEQSLMSDLRSLFDDLVGSLP
jgi:hypothetical protein